MEITNNSEYNNNNVPAQCAQRTSLLRRTVGCSKKSIYGHVVNMKGTVAVPRFWFSAPKNVHTKSAGQNCRAFLIRNFRQN